jgi:GT2 family glycosyltransferase
MEIIVVDDVSSDETADLVSSKFPRAKLVRNPKEQWLSASRNTGAEHANGKYIFFVDDDNILANECIGILVDFMESDQSIGVSAPLMYYYEDPRRVWFAGSKRNNVLAISVWTHANRVLGEMLQRPIPSDEFPNAFIVRTGVFRQVDGFDERTFPIHSGETDLCARIKRARYKMFVIPTAHIWHQIPLKFEREVAGRDEQYLFSMARSELLVSRKNSSAARHIIPFLGMLYVLKPMLGMGFHILSPPTKGNLRRLFAYLRGTLDGITSYVDGEQPSTAIGESIMSQAYQTTIQFLDSLILGPTRR